MLSRKKHLPGQRLTTKLNVLSFDCGIRNLCYCLIELIDEPDKEFAIRLWENFSMNSDSTAEAVFSLQRELDARPWMIHADHVVIEAQSNSNPTMKVISHALQMYFVCRISPPVISKEKTEECSVEIKKGRDINVHFISPKSKFKCANVPDPDNGAPGHAKNKRVAILMSKKLLAAMPDKSMLEYLMSHRKKDDLSDSFLQGLYFLRMIKQKQKSSQAIMDHLGASSEMTITENDEQETMPKIYLSKNYAIPEYDIDANSVHTSVRFNKR